MRPPVTQEQKRQIAEMRARGITNQKMADSLGLHCKTVSKIAAKLPLPDLLQITKSYNKPSPLSIKNAEPLMTGATKITLIPRFDYSRAPICTASMTGTYKGEELKYRR